MKEFRFNITRKESIVANRDVGVFEQLRVAESTSREKERQSTRMEGENRIFPRDRANANG